MLPIKNKRALAISMLEDMITQCKDDAADFAKKAAVNPFYAVAQEGTGMLLVGARWNQAARLLEAVKSTTDECSLMACMHEYKDEFSHRLIVSTGYMPNCTDAIVNVANCAEHAAIQEMYKLCSRLLNTKE